MPEKTFEQFHALVLGDIELQDKLRNGAEIDDFILQVIDLGSSLGYKFTTDDVIARMNANRRVWIERWI